MALPNLSTIFTFIGILTVCGLLGWATYHENTSAKMVSFDGYIKKVDSCNVNCYDDPDYNFYDHKKKRSVKQDCYPCDHCDSRFAATVNWVYHFV